MDSMHGSDLRRLERRIRRWEYNRACIIKKLRNGSGDVEALSSYFVLAQRKLEKLRSRAGVVGPLVPEASLRRSVERSQKRDENRRGASRKRECNERHGRSKSQGRRGHQRRDRSVGDDWRAAASRWTQELERAGLRVPRTQVEPLEDNRAGYSDSRSSTPSSATILDDSCFTSRTPSVCSGCGKTSPRRGMTGIKERKHRRRSAWRSGSGPSRQSEPYGFGGGASDAVAAALRALAPETSGLRQGPSLGSDADEALRRQLLASLQPQGWNSAPPHAGSADAALLRLMQQMHPWQPLQSHVD
eukprot:Hpha_TRINITY_DN7637_c0_g2::TRINITY_DN7637_c0_g2_i1::g.19325::m.19325